MAADRGALVTEGEAAMVRLLASVGESMLGEDATVQLARVASGSMARLAEAIVAAFRLRFELPRRSAGTRYIDVVREYTEIAETMLPAFVGMLDVMLRRDIVAVADRMWSTDADQTAVTLPRAIGFADLVGYTEAAAGLPARELASILAEFDERTADVVVRGGGQVVKTIGDEAMFVTEDPADACRIAAALVDELAGSRIPAVRVGVAAGEVVSVLGDVYGPDVNLASRLVGVADPSSVLVSASVYEACAGRFSFETVPPMTLKGFPAPVPVYRLDLASAG
jgi:adenylate cyclase